MNIPALVVDDSTAAVPAVKDVFTCTSNASSSPLFLTVNVYVTGFPAITDGALAVR